MDREVSVLDQFKQKLFEEAERLTDDATFEFGCHPGVPCFNKCCSDVNIFLTPYDVVRLKNRLGIDSEEFLARYTIMPIDKNQKFPILLLKMDDTEEKACHFVEKDKGCTVYEDRPWSCRMFPIGKASPQNKNARPFYFFMKEDVCEGWKEKGQWSIKQWMEDQKVEDYDEMGELYKDITLHEFFGKDNNLSPKGMEMFHMVCYNIDKFRLFVFNSTFLDRFDVPEERVEKMREDDVELLKFGFDWLRFSLFGDKTMAIKKDEETRIREKMEKEKQEKLAKEQAEEQAKQQNQ